MLKIVCHSSGWCKDSMAMEKREIESGSGAVLIRWDGRFFKPTDLGVVGVDEKFTEGVIERNLTIFKTLYHLLGEGDYITVPHAFTFTVTKTRLVPSKILEGLDEFNQHFHHTLLSFLGDTKHFGRFKVEMYYMTDCEHKHMYLPMWEKTCECLTLLCRNLFDFVAHEIGNEEDAVRLIPSSIVSSLKTKNVISLPLVVFRRMEDINLETQKLI